MTYFTETNLLSFEFRCFVKLFDFLAALTTSLGQEQPLWQSVLMSNPTPLSASPSTSRASVLEALLTAHTRHETDAKEG